MPLSAQQIRFSSLTVPQPREGIILHEKKANASSFNRLWMYSYHGTSTAQIVIRPAGAESLELIHAVVEQDRQRDRQRIESLEREVAELREAVGLDRPAPRKMSKTQAKKEIGAYFAQRDGQVVYPSDIAEDLNLDYDLVLIAINELEKDSKVSKA